MRRLTHDVYIDKLKLINTKVTVLSEYENSRKKISAKCNECSFVWNTSPRGLLRGLGCPECGKKKAAETQKWHLTQSHFINKIPLELYQKIEIRSEYISVNKHVDLYCKQCGYEWKSKPVYLYKGLGCKICGRKRKGEASRTTHENFTSRINKIHFNLIEVQEKYKTGRDVLLVRCLKCKNEWTTVASYLYRRGCPSCIFSNGEKKIETILKENNIPFKCQFNFDDLKGKGNRYLRFDFAVFSKEKLSHLIEYDGIQHYYPIKYMGGRSRFLVQKHNDNLKNEFCKHNNIRLIRVSYKDFSSLDLSKVI